MMNKLANRTVNMDNSAAFYLLVWTTALLVLSGCADTREYLKKNPLLPCRMYSGTELPLDKVSFLITFDPRISIETIDGSKPITCNRGHRQDIPDSISGPYYFYFVELIPGRHTLISGFQRLYYDGSQYSQDSVTFDVNLEPGHIYKLVSQFPGERMWNPALMDVTDDPSIRKITNVTRGQP
jgi:hypothetical protein